MAEVVIPTPELHCVAARALEMEGLEPRELICVSDEAYGQWFAELWDKGKPFVLVEWDIVPFPGAVQALSDCPKAWCTRRYPLHRGNVCRAFGIGKYVPHGPAPDEWRETEWQMLDGAVVPHLNKLFGHSHVHEPPVAHARRQAA